MSNITPRFFKNGILRRRIKNHIVFSIYRVIHPSQVPVVHRAFSPSQSKIEWATNLIKEFREHEKTGKGAFNFRGSMIDMPLVKQAENIVTMNEKMKKVRT